MSERTLKCEACLGEFTTTARNVKVCRACAEIRKQEYDKARMRDRGKKPVVVAKNIAEIALEAKKANMTYGQYVAMMGVRQ